MGEASSSPTREAHEIRVARLNAEHEVKQPADDPAPAVQHESTGNDAVDLSRAYKAGSFNRIACKTVAAGLFGTIFSPFFSPGVFPAVAVVGGFNAALIVGFYDTLREALTSLTLSDTPINSCLAGGVSGRQPALLRVHALQISRLSTRSHPGHSHDGLHAVMLQHLLAARV
jgi:hypothetical protein